MVPAGSSLPWHHAASPARALLNTHFHLVVQEAKGEGKGGRRGEKTQETPGRDEMLPQKRLLMLH